jgi:protein SCO1
MQELSRRKLISLATVAPVAGAILSANANAAGTRRTFVHETYAGARERIHQRYLPNVTLTTHEGKQVRFYDDLVKDKVVTFNFFYANCENVCPIVTANLVKVQRLLADRVGRDIFMYSFTLKPEEDTQDAIREYANMHGAKPGWTFLTGKPSDLEHLRRSLGFTYPDPAVDSDKEQHIGNVRYGNEPRMLWSACPGMAHAEWIAETLSRMIRSKDNLPLVARTS